MPETQFGGGFEVALRTQADHMVDPNGFDILMVAPAGNFGAPPNYQVRGPGFIPPPWLHPNQRQISPNGRPSGVLTVGSLNYCSDDRLNSSGRGPKVWNFASPYDDYPDVNHALIKPDVMAPGVHNLTTAAWNSCWHLQLRGTFGEDASRYNQTGETSGATPVVAGVALLMLCKDNELTPAEIDSIMETTASNYLPVKDPDIGSGTVNALAAVNAVEFFNHFDRMFNANPLHPTIPFVRNAEDTHWKSHPDAGTPSGQWRFVNSSAPPPALIDGVLEGEAPLGKRSLTTVHHDRQSYRIDFEFELKSFPAGGGHSTPIFGAMLRYDPTTHHSLYLKTLKEPNGQMKVVLGKEVPGDVVIASVTPGWSWSIDVPYAWHIWDDGSTVTLTVDRPGVSGQIVLNHSLYASTVSTARKGLFVQDGTRVQFDNVRIEGFAPASLTYSAAISRYINTPASSLTIAGSCPDNGNVAAHPGGVGDPLHPPGDYWIQVIVGDSHGTPIRGLWDVKLDLNACTELHTANLPAVPARFVFADAPTDNDGKTVFRNSMAFGGSDACAFDLKVGGTTLQAYGGLRNIDVNGDGITALNDLSVWQQAWLSQNPALRYRCDLDLIDQPCNPYCCSLGDLSIFNTHFQEPDHARGSVGSKKEDAQVGDTQLYWSVMDRIPSNAQMPVVAPDRAVTAVSGVGPRGRDITIGLYAVDYPELAGAHVRSRWPAEWALLGVGDSLVSGQVFAHPNRYAVLDHSYMTAFRCLWGGAPVAIGRFDVHATGDGEVAFDTENALVQVVDCRVGIRDLVEQRSWGGSKAKGGEIGSTDAPAQESRLVRVSAPVSNAGAEFVLSLVSGALVTATVYDVSGRVVMKLIDHESRLSGTHVLRWDGRTSRGGQAASGVYLFEVLFNNLRLTEEVVIVR